MSDLRIQLRKRCMMDAIQLWLDQQQKGWRVTDIIKPDPPEFEVAVTDTPKEAES